MSNYKKEEPEEKAAPAHASKHPGHSQAAEHHKAAAKAYGEASKHQEEAAKHAEAGDPDRRLQASQAADQSVKEAQAATANAEKAASGG